MSYLSSLPLLAGDQVQGYRLVNSKFPPIALFDDVANAEDFETLFSRSNSSSIDVHQSL